MGGAGTAAADAEVEEEVEEGEMEKQMQAMLGFGGFGTTKEKKIVGNDVYAVRKEKRTEYRQYMYVGDVWAGMLRCGGILTVTLQEPDWRI
jgi:hypothetical protein